jgi:hypothetical protein
MLLSDIDFAKKCNNQIDILGVKFGHLSLMGR